ncbi:MAG: phosphotransferase [Oscillospiraceae bacterium]|nr:phosphotransferase [Oscillospiraceae bacterium]
MEENQFILGTNEQFPKDRKAPALSDILGELSKFGIDGGTTVKLMDSTREAADIRLNYIIDKKWVLRFCNAPDMTEKRMGELNRLIGRYRTFGLQCPAFLADSDGQYLHPWEDLVCYLSEYIDLPLARERDGECQDEDQLDNQVSQLVARFAEAYRDVDLSETMGMYSLFDLNPYDAQVGMDEKQENFESLVDTLRKAKEEALAHRLEARHAEVRRKLKAVYRELPRCVFQGDENLSNVLVDEKQSPVGFIDFNLAGTEVIVNQLANLAGFEYGDVEQPYPGGAEARLELGLKGYQERIRPLLKAYHTTEQERQALVWYAWIVMVAQWPTASDFIYAIREGTLRQEICELLSLIADLPEERLSVR